MKQSKKLRIGVIGCGDIAHLVHFPTYLKLNKKVEIIAVADINRERADQAAHKYGINNIFYDAREMLIKAKPDAVSICTWNKSHAELTIAALEAGCDVLCEKPPAITAMEAISMEEAALKNNKILTYGFHYRYAPEVALLKKYIDAGELGEIYAAKAIFLRRRGIPGWGVFTNKELQGGGPLIDLGVHALDTTLHLMGYPKPTVVLGATYQKIGTRKGFGLLGEWDWKNYSVEDFARGMILFEDGRSVILETSFALNIEQKEILQISLFGQNAGADLFPVTLLNQSPTPLKIYGERFGTLVNSTPVYYVDPEVSNHELEITAFVEACRKRQQPLSTARQGTILQSIINGLYESALNGQSVQL